VSPSFRPDLAGLLWPPRAGPVKDGRCPSRSPRHFTVLVEIIARVDDDQIDLKLHWQGGDHTQLNVRKARSGEHRWILDAPTTDIIRDLARRVPDYRIAGILNRAG
jgi:hypothetical protein